jgi:hypothetical protein
MKWFTWARKAKIILSVLLLATCVGMGVRGREVEPVSGDDEVPTGRDEQEDLASGCRCGKVHPDYEGRGTCTPPVEQLRPGLDLVAPFGPVLERGESLSRESVFRRVSVSELVKRALDGQRRMLLAKLTELKRWSPSDRAAFAKWFGTTSEAARRLIGLLVVRVLELNKNYPRAISAGPTRPAQGSMPTSIPPSPLGYSWTGCSSRSR